MNRCRFIIGWMDGSDGACGESTGINSQDDLIAGTDGDKSKVVDVYEYDAPDGFEWQVGAAKAFHANFTAHDTISVVQILRDGKWE